MLQSLSLFGPLHFGMIFLVLLVIFFVQYQGVLAKKSDTLPEFSRRLGFLMLGIWFFYVLYNVSPSRFAWEKSLPLEVCDMLALASIFVLFSPLRLPRSVLYFSGILLTGQAILTPAGDQDPAKLRFWFYWIFHAGILAVSVFDCCIRGYRPLFRDLVQVWLVNLAYLVLVLPLDVCFGWNYGFVGNSKPGAPTLVDFFGPWPERVVLMFFLVCLAQAWIMYLPARLIGRKKKGNRA